MRAEVVYDNGNCSIARTLEVVGERWTLLVLREAFYGRRRFSDLHAQLGIARNILSARLRTLVEHGLLESVPYHEPGRRTRFEYHLTEKGRDLMPALLALMAWGDRHRADADGPAVVVEHRGCGSPVHVDLACAAGHRGIPPTEITPVPGPGARRIQESQPAP
jgi:DNA-binding HxlR family transcriptional regulator